MWVFIGFYRIFFAGTVIVRIRIGLRGGLFYPSFDLTSPEASGSSKPQILDTKAQVLNPTVEAQIVNQNPRSEIKCRSRLQAQKREEAALQFRTEVFPSAVRLFAFAVLLSV